MLLKISQNSLRPVILFEKTLRHKCFPINLMKFWRTRFFKEHLRTTPSVLIFASLICFLLTLSWQRPLSYRNQSIDLRSKSMDWFLYNNSLRHERINPLYLLQSIARTYLEPSQISKMKPFAEISYRWKRLYHRFSTGSWIRLCIRKYEMKQNIDRKRY